ncbi:MAG: hypothetical protein M1838_004115 [Thelocarpon superellum]|nr:MAG: hypothetical protein M1838_004115 [Thelocarpon superellum]
MSSNSGPSAGDKFAHREPQSEASSTSRTSPVRYEPITSDEPSDSDPMDEPRRPAMTHRVEPIPGGQYGSLAAPVDPRAESEASGFESNTETGDDTSRPLRRTASNSSYRRTRPSPDPPGTSRSKKPSLTRRGTSHAQTPHRGQQFSVDDDLDEVEQQRVQQHTPTAAASGRGSVRGKPATLRRRATGIPSGLPTVDSSDEDGPGPVRAAARPSQTDGTGPQEEDEPPVAAPAVEGDDHNAPTTDVDEDFAGDTGDDSDAEEAEDEDFTLKDRQDAINETHPFGIRIWKPALYKKNRSVQTTAEGDIHSSPGARVSGWLFFFNVLWTLLFGWWLALAALIGALVCFMFAVAPSGVWYGQVLWGLSRYILYPFGKFVRLQQEEEYADEDEGEGRSISEYERWQSGDLEDGRLIFGPYTPRTLVGRRRSSVDSATEHDSLLGRTTSGSGDGTEVRRTKRRLFGRGEWNVGRVIFFVFFYGLIGPLLLLVSGICWLLVFWIPMGKVTVLLIYHLRRHPLAMSFNSDGAYSRVPGTGSSILLCTYRAVGATYWKYTIDGTNIFLINLMGIVLFVIFDYWVLDVTLHLHVILTHPGVIFTLALVSIIPLAYFIGQAVASISAQTSMGLGAAINAFFSTIVEVFLYCVALDQGKGKLVEGSIIGSIFAGILFLPGLSMCFGAIKRKTQRFNAKSAGVTSTMLLFAVIAAFGPTLLYQIYGTHELNCLSCIEGEVGTGSRDCRRCYYSQDPTVTDRFFIDAVRPYCWLAAVLLFTSYVIGLWFTLRTHAAVIWATEAEEKKAGGPSGASTAGIDLSGSGYFEPRPSNGTLTRQNTMGSVDATGRTSVRDSQLYKRILNQSLRSAGLGTQSGDNSRAGSISGLPAPYMVPPRSQPSDGGPPVRIPGLSAEANQHLVREVAEMAATAATVAARDVTTRTPRKPSITAQANAATPRPAPARTGTSVEANDDPVPADVGSHVGGHDAPNWSRTKSSVILLGATILYAVIAEILVDTVDVVLESVDIDEKFLGMTLFALVPNTTEFLNAISFAMNGNIALSMEIGSAYALQVCLLQIPALVLFSAITGRFLDPGEILDHTFTLIFPQFDMVTVILCVFLLSYMYGEGKSNYFKGSILILSYLMVMSGFHFSGYTDLTQGESRFDVLSDVQSMTFKTIGQGRQGRAF